MNSVDDRTVKGVSATASSEKNDNGDSRLIDTQIPQQPFDKVKVSNDDVCPEMKIKGSLFNPEVLQYGYQTKKVGLQDAIVPGKLICTSNNDNIKIRSTGKFTPIELTYESINKSKHQSAFGYKAYNPDFVKDTVTEKMITNDIRNPDYLIVNAPKRQGYSINYGFSGYERVNLLK